MKRFSLVATLAVGLLGGGLVAAQTNPLPKPTADEHANHHPSTTSPADAHGGMGMGHGTMMGGGMMGQGMCPMAAEGAKTEVKKIAKGVTITITSDDPKVVERVQKMAENMRLMHEGHAAK